MTQALNPDLPDTKPTLLAIVIKRLPELHPSLLHTQNVTWPAWVQIRHPSLLFLWSQRSVSVLNFAFVLQLIARNSGPGSLFPGAWGRCLAAVHCTG